MSTKEITKVWGIRLIIVAVAAVWLALLAASWAEAAEPDEYSFSWLDPEKKIYVLQNRKYGKAKRLLVSAMAGQSFSNPYRTTYNFDPRFAYYPSEQWGLEVFYALSSNSENKTYTALRGTYSNVWPSTREIHSTVGALIHWVPWYAKINVFNQILYFDWYFSAGLGSIQSSLLTLNSSTNETLTAGILGTGHQYFLDRDWTIRLDFTTAIYSAPVGGTGENALFSNLNFAVGIGYRI